MNKKIIHVEHTGQLANKMFQYMFAHRLARAIKNSVISGCDIPEFCISTGILKKDGLKTISLRDGHDYNIDKISFLMNSPMFDQLIFSGYAMRVEYYKDIEFFRSIFSWPSNKESTGYGKDHIVVHIRLGDIATGIHEDYTPLPISFYKKIINSSGLKPVFVGQLDNGEYCNSLRDAFPDALYPTKDTPERDFTTIMTSKNIILSVSSFSWLSSYFSNADRIHLPIYGVYNPLQRPDINLLPVWDPRYQFYWLDPRKWTASDADWHHAIHGDPPLASLDVAQMGGLFRKISV